MQQPENGPSAVAYVFGALNAAAAPGPALMSLLGDLGVSETAGRTMLSRLVRSGALSSSKSGRVAVYRMEGGYRDRFLRIRHGDALPAWKGHFHTIVYDIPETRRRTRDALRDRATQAGFGMPRPGLLIGLTEPGGWCAPWSGRDDLFLETGTFRCSTETGRRLAERAWDLTTSAPAQQDLLDQLDRVRRDCTGQAPEPQRAFTLFYELMGEFARLTRSTPVLPEELTPDGSPGRVLPARLGEVSRLLGPGIDAHAESAGRALGVADLVEPLQSAV